jgi:hypothetical protein
MKTPLGKCPVGLDQNSKWKNATGEIITTFVYLPTSSDKFFLGTEDGKGTIKAPSYK